MIARQLLWVLAVCSQIVYGLHFYFDNDKSVRCFYQELSQTTVLVAKHEAYEFDENTQHYVRPDALSILITIDETFDNNHRVLSQKLNPIGDFTFTALDSGEHKICYRPIASGWFHSTKVKMHLDVAIGEGSHIDSGNEIKMNTLAHRVKILNERLLEIRREQGLMREREAAFRDQSEATNARVVRWTFIQLFVLGVTCAWQLNHLRGFFMKQKLV